jgi:hypothetical protein
MAFETAASREARVPPDERIGQVSPRIRRRLVAVRQWSLAGSSGFYDSPVPLSRRWAYAKLRSVYRHVRRRPGVQRMSTTLANRVRSASDGT